MTTRVQIPAFESAVSLAPSEPVTLPGGFQQSDETFDVHCDFVTAEKLGGKKNGRLGQLTWEFRTADVVNRNRRIYPAGVVAVAVQEFQSRIAKDIVFGNLDHPSIYDFDLFIVKLSDAAIKIVETTMANDTNIKVVADILDNPQGRQLVSVLEVDGNPGVSQRAIASFRDPTDEEIEKYNIPEDEFVSVAESLRLITYDVVSEPGFADAAGAKVTEHNQGASQMKTIGELRAQNPALYNLVVAEGKEAAAIESKAATKAMIDKALEDATPGIIEAAVKPINEKLEATESAKQKAIDALATVKPVMVELGIVNEKITDTEVAAKIATGEAKVATLEAEKAATEAKLAEANKQLAEHGKIGRVREALETVSKQFKDHPGHNKILEQLATRGIEDVKTALESAKALADFIESVNPAMKPGAPEAATEPKFEG